MTVTWTGFNNGGNTGNKTTTFSSPGPGETGGVDPNSVFTYEFPPQIGSYKLDGTSPASGFLTGAEKETTFVTATYVVVGDTTPPVITVPSDITVEATSVSGATVTYSTSAMDAVDGALTPTCTPASGSTFAIGTTTVACSATDAHDNTGSASFNVTVVDTTAPSVTVPGNITAEATGASGATVTYSASAADLVDGTMTPTCLPASGSTFALGTTTVTCTATDAHSNTGHGSFTVTVVDTTPPAVTVPANIVAEATSSAGAAVTFSASATDLVDGTMTPTCVPASGSTFALGTTTVTCSATDTHGNTSSGSFNVTVKDTTPPALTLPADITAEATAASGAPVTFAASANDIVDGTVAVICTPASGSTFALGTTAVNCTATDAHGNPSSGSFNVTVKDTTPPALTLPSNITAEATGASGAAVTFTASANDIVDGAVAVICTPASGSTFALGTTAVNCSATDAHGNTSSGSFNVTVKDTTPPVLTLPSNFQVTATSCGGANATYTASATDIVDGTVAVSCTAASGTLFGVGSNPVTCTATDAHNNTASGSFIITVVHHAPLASAGGPYTTNEGTAVTLTATGVNPDFDNANVTFAWDLDGNGYKTGAASVAFNAVNGPEVRTVKLLVTDSCGVSTAAESTVTINNVAPVITGFDAIDPKAVNTALSLTARFTDAGVQDTHSATFDWGDGTPIQEGVVSEAAGAGSATSTHVYAATGIYTVTVTVTDNDGASTALQYRYVVIYDPSAGFVTGGGWINSPAGAYVPDPTLTGKATFGFVSKYQKGQSVPTGDTQFEFRAGSLNFHSVSYEWLVVSGSKAQFKGKGTINNAGNYGFLLSAIDGSPDKFRIKIWDITSSNVVYDNQIGAADTADPTTALAGGSIVIHK